MKKKSMGGPKKMIPKKSTKGMTPKKKKTRMSPQLDAKGWNMSAGPKAKKALAELDSRAKKLTAGLPKRNRKK